MEARVRGVSGLRNGRTGAVLASEVSTAGTFFSRFLGLMGRRGLPDGGALYIPGCQSIHSFFMRFDFDAVFIDRDRRVVHVMHAMRPWRVGRMVWKAEGVVELPAGVAAATDTQPGDILEFA